MTNHLKLVSDLTLNPKAVSANGDQVIISMIFTVGESVGVEGLDFSVLVAVN